MYILYIYSISQTGVQGIFESVPLLVHAYNIFLIFNFYFHSNLKALLEVDSDNLAPINRKVLFCNIDANFC